MIDDPSATVEIEAAEFRPPAFMEDPPAWALEPPYSPLGPGDPDWAGDRRNLAALLRHMDDRGELASWRPCDFAYFLESPYKWQREWDRMWLAGGPGA